jgi:outer membrane lipoprotein-sorting protein
LVAGTVQLRLTPREGAAAQDDWESVRMWFTPDTLLPRLYVKTSWTGDLQIAELFGVTVNGEVDAARFDTTAPEPGSGWQVQISAWRGQP